MDIDFIAHSFVRKKEDVLAVKKIIEERNSTIKIISKIENQEGVNNIDEILDETYGIMVARGDLGVEIPAERIPGTQRFLVNKCIESKIPVIIATQMLHTMISNPAPHPGRDQRRGQRDLPASRRSYAQRRDGQRRLSGRSGRNDGARCRRSGKGPQQPEHRDEPRAHQQRNYGAIVPGRPCVPR